MVPKSIVETHYWISKWIVALVLDSTAKSSCPKRKNLNLSSGGKPTRPADMKRSFLGENARVVTRSVWPGK